MVDSFTVSDAVMVKSSTVLPEYEISRLLILPSGVYGLLGVSVGMVCVTAAGWMPPVSSAVAVTISSLMFSPFMSTVG